MTNDEILQIEERLSNLEDRLNNGIKYDSRLNLYILVWTEKELENTRREAKELSIALGLNKTCQDQS